jgi:hypothetical protein
MSAGATHCLHHAARHRSLFCNYNNSLNCNLAPLRLVILGEVGSEAVPSRTKAGGWDTSLPQPHDILSSSYFPARHSTTLPPPQIPILLCSVHFSLVCSLADLKRCRDTPLRSLVLRPSHLQSRRIRIRATPQLHPLTTVGAPLTADDGRTTFAISPVLGPITTPCHL